jgi:predicted RNase H-like HicB family nuclease
LPQQLPAGRREALALGVSGCIPPGIAPAYNLFLEASMKFIVNLDRDETGMVIAECPAIPGCVSEGRDEQEAISNIREAIQGCLEARQANGIPLTVVTREIEVSV